jgi:hypothetical protein
MTFQEALNEVVINNRVVIRRQFTFDGRESNSGPWSEWLKIRMEDSHFPNDAVVFFEVNGFDEVEKAWLHAWEEYNVTKADILADDWEFDDMYKITIDLDLVSN